LPFNQPKIFCRIDGCGGTANWTGIGAGCSGWMPWTAA
jgi:hypothetical protein